MARGARGRIIKYILIVLRRLTFFLVFILFLLGKASSLQGFQEQPQSVYRIIFYNVENLFDTRNNPDKNDDEYTPEGARRWTDYRLKTKVNNIYKAIAAAGEWQMPSIIGLCEVENRYVLEMLVTGTALKNSDYTIIHKNSADNRGIDVAVLYRKADFFLLDNKFIKIDFPDGMSGGTRDIVYLKGIGPPGDTLHVFVNHWPSRWGGQAESQPRRNFTAAVLRFHTDSILSASPTASIVVMGDFNDEPEDESLLDVLEALPDYTDPVSNKLYNISAGNRKKRSGSLKYQGEWFLFDQFIVSGALLNGSAVMQTSPEAFRVFNAAFLMVQDEAWFGYKPFRTYEGYVYKGGYSDHLPVIMDLWY